MIVIVSQSLVNSMETRETEIEIDDGDFVGLNDQETQDKIEEITRDVMLDQIEWSWEIVD